MFFSLFCVLILLLLRFWVTQFDLRANQAEHL